MIAILIDILGGYKVGKSVRPLFLRLLGILGVGILATTISGLFIYLMGGSTFTAVEIIHRAILGILYHPIIAGIASLFGSRSARKSEPPRTLLNEVQKTSGNLVATPIKPTQQTARIIHDRLCSCAENSPVPEFRHWPGTQDSVMVYFCRKCKKPIEDLWAR